MWHGASQQFQRIAIFGSVGDGPDGSWCRYRAGLRYPMGAEIRAYECGYVRISVFKLDAAVLLCVGAGAVFSFFSVYGS